MAMRPGQDLAAAGYVGLKGTAVIAQKKEDELLTRFSRRFVDGCKRVNGISFGEAGDSAKEAFWKNAGATGWLEAGDGGILAALWNFLEESGLGCDLELRALPILQETVEVCEMFDLNPYRLRSEGCVLLAADNGGDLVRSLEAQGIRAAVIGKVAKGPGKRIHNGENEGFLNRPEPDELERIL